MLAGSSVRYHRQRAWPFRLLAAGLAFLATSALGADSVLLKVSELLQSPTAREILERPVTLYWGSQVTPEYAEVARGDNYTRWSITRNPFGGSAKHCVDAFEQALRALVNDAADRGYDAVIGLKAQSDSKTSDDPDAFYCKPGYRSTEVSLTGSFAMTAAAVQRAAEEDAFVLEGPPRPPWGENIYLPLEPILASPEAKTILGSDVTAHWGLQHPPYSERQGPDVYYDYADLATFGREGACTQAALKVLGAMAEYARGNNYDAVIRIRSYLYDLHTPVATDFECEIGRKKATVRLQGTLAKKKT
jgi:uncharacterized protein YbjQ (UPF0145 family)